MVLRSWICLEEVVDHVVDHAGSSLLVNIVDNAMGDVSELQLLRSGEIVQPMVIACNPR